MQQYDVAIAGLGPVGAVLALRLSAAGMSVLVIEPSAEVFALPRAIAADDEVQQLLSVLDPDLVAGMVHDQPVRFVSAGRTLGEIRFPSRDGFCGLAFFHQPTLERGLRSLLTCDVLQGAVSGVAQDGSGVTVSVGAEQVRASWLVGCDGAASTVRSLAGIAWQGRDLPHRWWVVDTVGQWRDGFTYTCDPVQPTVDMPMPGGHRWEFFQRSTGPGPSGAGPSASASSGPVPQVPLPVVRAVSYSFAARRAATWRVGRVLLAGDAAHTMPPFAGQGLGAGIRDAFALGALLPAGRVDEYERLRAPHVREMTRLSLLVGGILQARRGAGVRDALLSGAFRAPGLGPWLARGGPRRPASGVLDLL